MDENDINYRGEFTFSVNKTEILWEGMVVDTSYLEIVKIISIVSYGEIQETYPSGITDVTKIVI